MKSKLSFITILFCTITSITYTQTPNTKDVQLNEMANAIEQHYIYENIGRELSNKLRKEIVNGSFNEYSDIVFADSISAFLVKHGNDKHFNVLHKPDFKKSTITIDELINQDDSINKQINYMFDQVQRLDGNIGYIKYSGFHEKYEPASEILAASMNFIANTNALIIDLRDNHGGSGRMVEAFLSYFFNEKQELGSLYTRFNNESMTFYTQKEVSGKKYLNKPIYILVNDRTISAAEALAYNLQVRGKAKILEKKRLALPTP